MLDSFKFHHIGVAVRSIKDTADMYVQGGYSMSSIIFDPIQNVNICWLQKDGMPIIELLEPVDETSPVCNYIKKIGVTPYHLCYIVESIDVSLSVLRKQRYTMVSKPEIAIAINNSRVAFFYNVNVGLIELVEAPAVISW